MLRSNCHWNGRTNFEYLDLSDSHFPVYSHHTSVHHEGDAGVVSMAVIGGPRLLSILKVPPTRTLLQTTLPTYEPRSCGVEDGH